MARAYRATALRGAEWSLAGLALAMILLAANAAPAQGATLHVANNGVDGAACGSRRQPCRSITLGIAHASEGDTVEIGPGRYGDLDGDGVLGGEGEEAPPAACLCMIHVAKRVTLRSARGALSTVLDARRRRDSSQPGPDIVVRIDADGVVFGAGVGRGFMVIGDGVGILVAPGRGGVNLADNLAVANGSTGFVVWGDDHVLDSNVAVANRGGGFFVVGQQALLFQNLASANASSGFFFQGLGSVFRQNQATANGDVGFVFLPPPPPPPPPDEIPVGPPIAVAHLIENAARGNRSAGIRLWAPVTMERTTVYGNGDDPQFVPANCGLVNESGAVVDATRTYWGAATGPGAAPADNAGPGSGCDIGAGSATIVAPFAAAQFGHPNPGIK